MHWIDLARGPAAGSTPYARLSVRVLPVLPGRSAPPVGLEQFDAAPAGVPMYAFADGWYELEEDPATGRLWRWTSARSTLELKDWRPVTTLVIEGESPLRYFDRPPTIIVRAGDREISRFTPATDFLAGRLHPWRRPPGLGRPGDDRDRPDLLPGRAAPERGSAESLGLQLTRVEVK